MDIAFSEAWKLYRASGMDNTTDWFSIGYRKKDGSWGFKPKVRRKAGNKKNSLDEKKDLNTITKQVRQAGTMELETADGIRFEIKALGLMEINGKKIDHRF